MPILTNEYLKYDPQLPSVLYHYCSVDTLISIIRNHSIWMSDAEKTNDSTEMKWLFARIQEVISETILSCKEEYPCELLQKTEKIAYETIERLMSKKAPITRNSKSFLLCFSEASDLLSQWRGYGNDGKGVAIGFNTDILQNFALTKVIYDREDTSKFLHKIIDERLRWVIESNVDKEKNEDNELQLCMDITTLMISIWQESFVYKNDKFSEEKEWRIFRRLQSNNYCVSDGIDTYGYADYLDGFFNENNNYLGAFTRSSIKFRSVGDDLRIYFEVGFEKRKKEIKAIEIRKTASNTYKIAGPAIYFNNIPKASERSQTQTASSKRKIHLSAFPNPGVLLSTYTRILLISIIKKTVYI